MPLLCPTAVRAFSAPVETTLRQLLAEYELDVGEGLLISLATLSEAMAYFGLNCSPDLGAAGLDDRRVLALSAATSKDLALGTIAGGETASVEFKSSLCFDRRKFAAVPGLAMAEYRLDALVHAAMKTIAAFANTDGGTLFVGVADDLTVCGLREDFVIVNEQQPDFDAWDLYLRGQIESRFVDGKTVNAYVKTEAFANEDETFVKTQVAARGELTFLRKAPGPCELYIRSGTSSIAVAYEDIHKHYDLRRKF